MRTYPCYLKSRVSGNVFRFDTPGYRCVVHECGDRASISLTVGQNYTVGSHSEDKGWWIEVQTTYKYDPNQCGDTDDDV